MAMTNNNKLKTIIYDRGSLQVLDQRELPSKYQYVEINNSTDGRNAIKDMVVRGASAIAIVAALSLAVEVDKLKLKKEQAAAFLKNRLDDLVLSRPTIANLSNAAKELKEIASNAVAKGNVFKAYIKDAKAMLEKDVDSNRQIGSYGAQFLHEKIPNKKISVLTHCNTGNLATAGYGTAYGVICNLFARQRLDRVYCTETRPFNEGSRLTVLELLNQKIPAALIADSAAASLMGGERVNVVIVGANCIAANGDTANTIGTYSLSIYARCHKIPFYVVAPFTSIDLSLSTGQEFEIEERSGKELLHLWEGQIDEKSAASMGLHVWNPVFDVTPAKQIDAIITNKGVIGKINGAFDIKGFVANHSPAPTKTLTRKQPARRCKNYNNYKR